MTLGRGESRISYDVFSLFLESLIREVLTPQDPPPMYLPLLETEHQNLHFGCTNISITMVFANIHIYVWLCPTELGTGDQLWGGEGAAKREGGSEVLSLQKGGGAEKGLAILKGGHKKL